jgi:hypothetical protein
MPTYYVDNVLGNDINAGTSPGAGNAFATINKCASAMTAAGDKGWVRNTGTNYAEVVNITTANGSAAGTTSAPCVLSGYTTTPGDSGQPIITGSGSRANCLVINRTNWHLKSFILQKSTTRHIDGTAAINLLLDRVQFLRDGTTAGTFISSSTFSAITLRAKRVWFEGATSGSSFLANISGQFLDCDFRNLSSALTLASTVTRFLFDHCRIFNHTGNFLTGTSSNANIRFANCSFDTLTGDAIDVSGTTSNDIEIYNNVFCNVNGAGKTAIRCAQNALVWVAENAFFNCTANYAGGVATEGGDVTLTALPWVGSGDFTPNAQSFPIRNTGIALADLGARGVVDVEYPIPIIVSF